MFTTYFATYLQVVGHLSRAQSLMVSTMALLFAAGACPAAGAFSDRFGRRRTVAVTCFWVILTVFPAYWLASSGQFYAAIVGVILLAVGAVLSGVVTAALLSEVFPTRTRYTASAITYNIAYTLFGGTAPLVATWLIDHSGSSLAPAFYLVLIALLALLGGLSLPETSRISLHEEPGEKPVCGLKVISRAG
ncbi:MFS family permease [Pseudomonas sp. PvP001]